jgi:hypothetical protein
MATKGSTNLNRILKVTAHLLFERGQSVEEIYGLMQGFVQREMLQKWYSAYCSQNGIPSDTNQKRYKRRMPMPPIDWAAITIGDLEERTESALDWL